MIWDQIKSEEKGITLLSMAIQLVIISLFLTAALHLYETYKPYKASADTYEKIESIQNALEYFYVRNGRYPCPAPLDAGFDTARFGQEVTNECETTAVAGGTFRAPGRDGRTVRTGAVPVRTLNLPDKYMFDGYGQRLVYAVTELYAQEGTIPGDEDGGIFVRDANNNDATSIPGNVVQIVFSMGEDSNGAYNMNGIQLEPCDDIGYSGQNCNFDDDAIFVNTMQKSYNQASANYFTHMISYGVTKPLLKCQDTLTEGPKNTFFLIDTSASMEDPGMCPPSMPVCSRMDVARWAMRRVVPAAIHSASISDEPGTVSMTGFVDHGSAYSVGQALEDEDNNPVFYNPQVQADRERSDETTAEQLNTKLMSMCPAWFTPLANHLDAIAEDLGDGEEGRPNKITVVSDGISNWWQQSPESVARHIRDTYPNMEVDIIDVMGNPDLMYISQETGGKYYTAGNPDELLEALYNSAGICDPYVPVPPIDQKGCGSRY